MPRGEGDSKHPNNLVLTLPSRTEREPDMLTVQGFSLLPRPRTCYATPLAAQLKPVIPGCEGEHALAKPWAVEALAAVTSV